MLWALDFLVLNGWFPKFFNTRALTQKGSNRLKTLLLENICQMVRFLHAGRSPPAKHLTHTIKRRRLQYDFVFLFITFSVNACSLQGMDVTRARSVLIFSSRKFIIPSGSVSRRCYLFEAI